MKNILCVLTCLLLIVSCKKTDNTTGGNNYGDPLVPENTGWKRVAAIKHSGTHVDAQLVPHEMNGFDIIVNGGALQVLYSEDKFENGDRFPVYFKATTALIGGAEAVSTELSKMPTVVRFRPGTYNAETYKFVP